MSVTIAPREDNVIIKLIQPNDKIGSIVIPNSAKEVTTVGEVIATNPISYSRDGTRRECTLSVGDRVRIPKGSVGTGVPEAPDGETWLCVPEDCILYLIK